MSIQSIGDPVLNVELFIANRLRKANTQNHRIAAPILNIAIAAIAMGLVMMLITIATGIGLQRKIREKVAAFHGHIQISTFDSNQSPESWIPIVRDTSLYSKIHKVKGIQSIHAIASKIGILRTESNFEGIILKGTEVDYDWQHIKSYLIEGRIPIFSTQASQEVLISSFLANRLLLKLGDKIHLYFLKKTAAKNPSPNIRVFRISGIYNSGFQEFDSKYIFADIRHIQRMNKWSTAEVGELEVFVDDFDQMESIAKSVYKSIPSALDATPISITYARIFEWLKLFDFNIYGIIGIIILVAGINMITALLVLIMEQTQMIGILKAFGATNWSIRKLFLYQSMHLIVKGLVWGNAIGLGSIALQHYYPLIRLDPATYYVSIAPVYIGLSHIILINLFTVVLCMLLLLIPSYVITKINPAKAIRFA